MFQSSRAQFKYVVKTSRSGKQGRKYIQVGKTLSDAPAVLRKPVKKPSARTVREAKSTKLGVPASVPSAKTLPGNVGRRGRRGTRLADELAQSNSDTEIPETQAARRATMGKTKPPNLGQDTMETQKSSGSKKRTEDKITGRTGGTLDAYCLASTSGANVSDAKSRPQRRKRSMEERLPDFLMEVVNVISSGLIITILTPLQLQVPGGGERRAGGRGGKRVRRGDTSSSAAAAKKGLANPPNSTNVSKSELDTFMSSQF